MELWKIWKSCKSVSQTERQRL